MATRIFLVLIMAILVLMIATFSLSLVEKEEIALIENQEGKSLNIVDDLYDIEGNQIPLESLLEGKVLLNVWASWCITCLVEHPFLKSITQSKDVKLIGINYKDQSFNAEKYLLENGDPYIFSIYDLSGEFSLKLGVTGAPETFLLIDGVIVSHRIGEVNMEIWNEKFAQYF
jgi:cytochrome c biogenesis protein CcmG/thiol:disulfide interchange protein DsbE|tara:strand:+ start:577 stop:1092 length:516 start_codon:yes stop_codon:yes gene_type:complete